MTVRLRGPVAFRRELEPPGGSATRPQFVPAGWVVLALAVARRLLGGAAIGKIGIAGLVWSVAPPKLKLVAVGMALWAAIVVLGAMAAIVLVALQLG